jgi:RNA polymerase sigma-70 factor (ECF subfamily)
MVTPGGDEERFERLFADHIDAVLGYALARVDAETAKDAVADTFLVAWRRLEDVPDPARAWLLGVTRRVLSGQRRSRRRQLRLMERLASSGPGSDISGEFTDLVTDRAAVAAALSRLRPLDRELLCLVVWDGLDHDQAAAVLECSAGTFAVRFHRARKRFEAALAAEDDFIQASSNSTDSRPAPDRPVSRSPEVPLGDS